MTEKTEKTGHDFFPDVVGAADQVRQEVGKLSPDTDPRELLGLRNVLDGLLQLIDAIEEEATASRAADLRTRLHYRGIDMPAASMGVLGRTTHALGVLMRTEEPVARRLVWDLVRCYVAGIYHGKLR